MQQIVTAGPDRAPERGPLSGVPAPCTCYHAFTIQSEKLCSITLINDPEATLRQQELMQKKGNQLEGTLQLKRMTQMLQLERCTWAQERVDTHVGKPASRVDFALFNLALYCLAHEVDVASLGRLFPCISILG